MDLLDSFEAHSSSQPAPPAPSAALRAMVEPSSPLIGDLFDASQRSRHDSSPIGEFRAAVESVGAQFVLGEPEKNDIVKRFPIIFMSNRFDGIPAASPAQVIYPLAMVNAGRAQPIGNVPGSLVVKMSLLRRLKFATTNNFPDELYNRCVTVACIGASPDESNKALRNVAYRSFDDDARVNQRLAEQLRVAEADICSLRFDVAARVRFEGLAEAEKAMAAHFNAALNARAEPLNLATATGEHELVHEAFRFRLARQANNLPWVALVSSASGDPSRDIMEAPSYGGGTAAVELSNERNRALLRQQPPAGHSSNNGAPAADREASVVATPRRHAAVVAAAVIEEMPGRGHIVDPVAASAAGAARRKSTSGDSEFSGGDNISADKEPAVTTPVRHNNTSKKRDGLSRPRGRPSVYANDEERRKAKAAREKLRRARGKAAKEQHIQAHGLEDLPELPTTTPVTSSGKRNTLTSGNTTQPQKRLRLEPVHAIPAASDAVGVTTPAEPADVRMHYTVAAEAPLVEQHDNDFDAALNDQQEDKDVGDDEDEVLASAIIEEQPAHEDAQVQEPEPVYKEAQVQEAESAHKEAQPVQAEERALEAQAPHPAVVQPEEVLQVFAAIDQHEEVRQTQHPVPVAQVRAEPIQVDGPVVAPAPAPIPIRLPAQHALEDEVKAAARLFARQSRMLMPVLDRNGAAALPLRFVLRSDGAPMLPYATMFDSAIERAGLGPHALFSAQTYARANGEALQGLGDVLVDKTKAGQWCFTLMVDPRTNDIYQPLVARIERDGQAPKQLDTPDALQPYLDDIATLMSLRGMSREAVYLAYAREVLKC